MSECIEWQGTMWSDGYGRIGRKVRAHRKAWEDKHGPIPDGLFVCHRCNNKACVNPDHLYLGTPKQNIVDAYNDGLINNPKGEAHPNSKVTDEIVRQIRADNRTYIEMSADYGLSTSRIGFIKRREGWRHVT